MDSMATNHVYNMIQRFQVTKELDEGKIYLTLGVETRVPVHSSGIAELYINLSVFILSYYQSIYPVTHVFIYYSVWKIHLYLLLRDNRIIKKR
jgi:hypothetical protein